MKKILLALNQESWSLDAVDTACYLSKLSGSVLRAAFIHVNGVPSWSNFSTSPDHVITKTINSEPVFRKRLKDACDSRETRYSILDHDLTVEQLIEETLFTDILIIDPGITSGHHTEAAPSSLAKHILHHAHCPVILAQGSFQDTNEIIFAYDGSSAACKAIKQFTYLFPEFVNRRVKVLEIDPDRANDAPAKAKMLEWMTAHYYYVAYIILTGSLSSSLPVYLLSHSGAFVVMGAYGRSILSRMLKPSSSNLIAGTVNNSFFITHD